MARDEYLIYADESIKEGEYFSNFYGGLLLNYKKFDEISRKLIQVKESLNLYSEVKWSKVTPNYLEKYKSLITAFFQLVVSYDLKVRIMFTQNRYVPVDLSDYQKEHEYFLLYYQFIKHAFGLKHIESDHPIYLRIYLDKLPDTKEKVATFRSYLSNMDKSPPFRRKGITIPKDQIAEVVSHKHTLLQMVDIILGAMQFRLNDKHKIKPKGSRIRGKKTRAKEKLYKYIHQQIEKVMFKNFNIGISTGKKANPANEFHHPYRHWLFIPKDHIKDDSQTK